MKLKRAEEYKDSEDIEEDTKSIGNYRAWFTHLLCQCGLASRRYVTRDVFPVLNKNSGANLGGYKRLGGVSFKGMNQEDTAPGELIFYVLRVLPWNVWKYHPPVVT